ncbi:hypothetical protein CCP3SC15_1860004 [Gammaproteobacteria bacterium]
MGRENSICKQYGHYPCTNAYQHTKDLLTCEVNERIAQYTRFNRIDFFLSQFVIWLQIGASLAASIMAGLGIDGLGTDQDKRRRYRRIAAIIAAIPAATLAISSQLNFEGRAHRDTDYIIRLGELRRELLLDPSDSSLKQISYTLTKIEQYEEQLFPYSTGREDAGKGGNNAATNTGQPDASKTVAPPK